MFEFLHLAYLFTAFAGGIAGIGGVLVLARVRRDTLATTFLMLYGPLTIAVLAALIRGFIETRPMPSAAGLFAANYMEAFVGLYGIMLGMPLFAHRVFAVADRRRTIAIIGVVLGSFVLQHITEFWSSDVWDQRGDHFEDLVFAGIVAYTVWLGVRHRRDPRLHRPLAERFLVLSCVGVPIMGYDVFISDGPGLRLYPLWYISLSAVILYTLINQRPVASPGVSLQWNLSGRERDVLRLVRVGLGNEAIALELSISVNTVKTHLRSIFDKSGHRSRVALIGALASSPPPEDSERSS